MKALNNRPKVKSSKNLKMRQQVNGNNTKISDEISSSEDEFEGEW